MDPPNAQRLAQHGSGNLLADRRFAYAEALLEDGDPLAAAELFAQAAEQAPAWAPAHLAQALALEKAGHADAALAACRTAAEHDHDGRFGAALHAARLAGTPAAAMPPAYVATLFDQYAPRFDAHLLGALDYRGPAVIRAALTAAAPGRRFGATLDLGCGTGLMAQAMAGAAGPIDGADLSPGMVSQAKATGLYRTLHVGDAVTLMQGFAPAAYELVLAADVLVYLGDIGPVFAAAAHVLAPGGLFAATVEAGAEGVTLGPDLRFRHGEALLRETLAASGFAPVTPTPCVTRREGGRDVPGLVFVAHRP